MAYDCLLICKGTGCQDLAVVPREGARGPWRAVTQRSPRRVPCQLGFCSPSAIPLALPGAPEGSAAWSPRPALGVDVRTPGPERSGLWGECQVGGGGNSNQIRHTALRPCRASRGGESRGRRKQERFEARGLPLTLLLLCFSGKRSPFKLCWGKPSCPARVQPGGRALRAGRAG